MQVALVRILMNINRLKLVAHVRHGLLDLFESFNVGVFV